MNHFHFIDDAILRSNLDQALAHIADLYFLTKTKEYKDKVLLISSLRKTIIIHTASVIEALLLWKLKQNIQTRKVKIDEWRYFDIKTLYKINEMEEIIAGSRKLEEKELNKLDFLRITDQCEKYKLIRPKLRKEIDQIRELRNKLHIGGLSEIEKEYRNSDLEFCFNTAEQVKNLVSK